METINTMGATSSMQWVILAKIVILLTFSSGCETEPLSNVIPDSGVTHWSIANAEDGGAFDLQQPSGLFLEQTGFTPEDYITSRLNITKATSAPVSAEFCSLFPSGLINVDINHDQQIFGTIRNIWPVYPCPFNAHGAIFGISIPRSSGIAKATRSHRWSGNGQSVILTPMFEKGVGYTFRLDIETSNKTSLPDVEELTRYLDNACTAQHEQVSKVYETAARGIVGLANAQECLICHQGRMISDKFDEPAGCDGCKEACTSVIFVRTTAEEISVSTSTGEEIKAHEYLSPWNEDGLNEHDRLFHNWSSCLASQLNSLLTSCNEPINNACPTSGSFIETENQIVHEAFPLPGTPFELVYSSDRQPGYKQLNRPPRNASELGLGGLTLSVQHTVEHQTSTSEESSHEGLYLLNGRGGRTRVHRLSSIGINPVIVVPDQNIGPLFYFDDAGRHIASVDSLSKKTLFSLEYDSIGKLERVSAPIQSHNERALLTIVREGSHVRLIGAGETESAIDLASNGYAESLTVPGKSPIRFIWNTSNLLVTISDGDNVKYFRYSQDGRLLSDKDIEGRGVQLDQGISVTALGVTRDISVKRARHSIPSDHFEGNTTKYSVLSNGSRLVRWDDGDEQDDDGDIITTTIPVPELSYGVLTIDNPKEAWATTYSDGSKVTVSHRPAALWADDLSDENRTAESMVINEPPIGEGGITKVRQSSTFTPTESAPNAPLDREWAKVETNAIITYGLSQDESIEELAANTTTWFRPAGDECDQSFSSGNFSSFSRTTSPAGRVTVVESDQDGRPTVIRPGALAPVTIDYALPDTDIDIATISAGNRKVVLTSDWNAKTTSSVIYDGNNILTSSSRTFDAAWRPASVSSFDGETISMEYNPVSGYPESLDVPSDNELPSRHAWTWTPSGQLLQYLPPNGEPTTYTYYADGIADRVILPGDISVHQERDAMGRVWRVWVNEASSDMLGVLTYEYRNSLEELARISYESGIGLEDGRRPTVESAYIKNGLVSTTTQSYNQSNLSVPMGRVSFENDLLSMRHSSIKISDAEPIDVEIDADGFLVQMGDMHLQRDVDDLSGSMCNHTGTGASEEPGSSSWGAGLLASAIFGTVSRTDYGYNQYGDLVEQITRHFDQMNDEFAFLQVFREPHNLNTQRDALGRLRYNKSCIDNATTCSTWTYTYDNAGRLSTAILNGEINHTYVYDANGNRLTKSITGPSISITEDGTSVDAQDRLLTYSGSVYDYNDAGQMTLRDDWVLDYDPFGNLNSATADSTKVEYLHDGLGRRVARREVVLVDNDWVVGPWTWWIYVGLNPVAEYDNTGRLQKIFVYATMGHSPDYMVVFDGVNETKYRFLTDHLGSVRGLLDENGLITGRVDYDPFGIPTAVGPAGPKHPFGFAGGLYDPTTGLVRFGARDYDPITGRWTAKDPIRFAGGDTNLYAYCGGDPVNCVDSSGLLPYDAPYTRMSDGAFDAYVHANNVLAQHAFEFADDALFWGGLFYFGWEIYLGRLALAGTRIAWECAPKVGGLVDDAVRASTPVGRRGAPLQVTPGTNSPSVIGGRNYTGHALDRMQGRGLTPTVVENAIQHGVRSPGSQPGTFQHVFEVVRVITNESGGVITVIPR